MAQIRKCRREVREYGGKGGVERVAGAAGRWGSTEGWRGVVRVGGNGARGVNRMEGEHGSGPLTVSCHL